MKSPLLVALLLAAASSAPDVKLGVNASLGGRSVFPGDSGWNIPVTDIPVDPRSKAYIESIGASKPLHPDFGASNRGRPFGIPYVVVGGDTPRLPVFFRYWQESDRAPFPIPANPLIEGGDRPDADHHVIIVDRDNWTLYELSKAALKNGMWTADSGAIWDMSRNHTRPEGWTSADAAGLPVFAGLVRYDEVVEQKEIRHALRFTARKTQRAYVWPASHWASRDTNQDLPPMGVRLRLKAAVDLSRYPPTAQVIVKALRRYGMILADNGSSGFLSGVPDPRWNDSELNSLQGLKIDDFEVILTGNVVAPER